MTKSSGIDTYKVTQNSIFLLPVGQITTTTSISKELKGFYCHFSNNFLTETKSQLDILSQFPFLEWLNNPICKVSPRCWVRSFSFPALEGGKTKAGKDNLLCKLLTTTIYNYEANLSFQRNDKCTYSL